MVAPMLGALATVPGVALGEPAPEAVPAAALDTDASAEAGARCPHSSQYPSSA
jgi:hypothetical protein